MGPIIVAALRSATSGTLGTRLMLQTPMGRRKRLWISNEPTKSLTGTPTILSAQN